MKNLIVLKSDNLQHNTMGRQDDQEKNAKQRPILYEKLCMKLYLNDEKTPVDPLLLTDIL